MPIALNRLKGIYFLHGTVPVSLYACLVAEC